MNNSGELEPASTDRITETIAAYAQINTDWWQQSQQKVYVADNQPTATSTGIQRNRLTGLGASGLVAESVSIDLFGNQTVSKAFINRDSKTETRTIDYPDSNVDAQSVSVKGFLMSSITKTGVTFTYEYDALGRQTGVTDPRTGTSTTHYNAQGRVDYVQDPTGNRTTFAYDLDTGRKISETNALGNTTRYAYNLQGQVTHTWGDATYPVSYEYNEFGQMTAMNTYRTEEGWDGTDWPTTASGDTTTWTYDVIPSPLTPSPGGEGSSSIPSPLGGEGQGEGASGLLISKTDAANNAATYTYDASGRLATRTWARTQNSAPVTTTYAYDPAAGDLTGIDYSDATADITFVYDRLGRQTQITDASGIRTFEYTDNLQLTEETMSGMINQTLTRNYEDGGVAGRGSGFTVQGYEVSYGYDAVSRMNQVGWNANSKTGTANYTYAPNSDLLASVSVNGDLNTAYTYEQNRNVKTQVQNAYGAQVVSQYDYAYDAFGRRTSVVNTGTAFTADAHNAYGYNDRNELTESARYQGSNPAVTTDPVQPEYRAYQYDPIGNRKTITEAANSGNYTANNVNQYAQQTIPADGTRTFDYDEDGNLISLIENGSGKVYTWNAENRLVAVAPATPSDGDKKVEFVYDYMGRRVQKKVFTYESSAFSLQSNHLYIYNGWNLVEEITEVGATTTSRYFVWGLDLSQSLQGAGGIGGLIATVNGSASYLYCYDANGNVGQLVNAADGAITAKYEYDPYGKPIRAEGAYANSNPFRFSTKYHDDETGLYYFGYRFYSPEFGRWLSKDPIEERGGINLYEFALNNGINISDVLGLYHADGHRNITSAGLAQLYLYDISEPEKIMEIIIEGNLSQDSKHLSDNRRHYNMDANWVKKETRDQRIAADDAYGSYLDEEDKIFKDHLNKVDESYDDLFKTSECFSALESLGLLTHSWEDFFAHAISKNPNQGFIAFSVGITGTPYSRSNFWPSTFGFIAPSEHPWREPVRDPEEYNARYGAAINFVIEVGPPYLEKWFDKCKCWADKVAKMGGK